MKWHQSLIILVFLCTSIKTFSAGQNPLDDLFKDFDFDSFLKEMEQSFDEGAEKKSLDSPTKDFKSSPAPQQSATEKIITTNVPEKKPQTKEELFLTPITHTIQEKGGSSKTKLSLESLNAFKEIMHEFIILLSSVAKLVNDSRLFSLPFKEQFLRYNDAIDKIAISYGTLVSKKKYATIIPIEPPLSSKEKPQFEQPQKTTTGKEANKTRKNILNAIKELRSIDQDLTKKLAAKEQDTDEATLKKLSLSKNRTFKFDKIPSKKTQKKRQKNTHSSKKPTPDEGTKNHQKISATTAQKMTSTQKHEQHILTFFQTTISPIAEELYKLIESKEAKQLIETAKKRRLDREKAASSKIGKGGGAKPRYTSVGSSGGHGSNRGSFGGGGRGFDSGGSGWGGSSDWGGSSSKGSWPSPSSYQSRADHSTSKNPYESSTSQPENDKKTTSTRSSDGDSEKEDKKYAGYRGKTEKAEKKDEEKDEFAEARNTIENITQNINDEIAKAFTQLNVKDDVKTIKDANVFEKLQTKHKEREKSLEALPLKEQRQKKNDIKQKEAALWNNLINKAKTLDTDTFNATEETKFAPIKYFFDIK